MSLNPLDDLGDMIVYCPHCGAENIIYVGYAIGGSDECWCCNAVIPWSIKRRKIFIDKGNIVERS